MYTGCVSEGTVILQVVEYWVAVTLKLVALSGIINSGSRIFQMDGMRRLTYYVGKLLKKVNSSRMCTAGTEGRWVHVWGGWAEDREVPV